jgi:hypothetical protein
MAVYSRAVCDGRHKFGEYRFGFEPRWVEKKPRYEHGAEWVHRDLMIEFWYFDYGAATAYSVIDYPDEVAAATAQLSSNAAGYARVTIRPLLTAEEMDKAVAKWPPVRPPQQQ